MAGRYVLRTRRQCPNCEGIMSLEDRCWVCGAVMQPVAKHAAAWVRPDQEFQE